MYFLELLFLLWYSYFDYSYFDSLSLVVFNYIDDDKCTKEMKDKFKIWIFQRKEGIFNFINFIK